MFLAFPLDYQTLGFIKAVVAPFGDLLHWFEGPNKSRILTQCLVLTQDRVPRSVVVSQGTTLGVMVVLGQYLFSFLEVIFLMPFQQMRTLYQQMGILT